MNIGGIKIERAKELLRSRDKVDRKCERERIGAAHHEMRLKSHQAIKVGDDIRDGEVDVASGGVETLEEQYLTVLIPCQVA